MNKEKIEEIKNKLIEKFEDILKNELDKINEKVESENLSDKLEDTTKIIYLYTNIKSTIETVIRYLVDKENKGEKEENGRN